MASKFMRRKTWWIKFQHPATGEILRESLATHDPARAELLRERLELEIALLDPRFQAVEVPEGVRRLIPAQSLSEASDQQLGPQPAAQQVLTALPPQVARVPFDEAITAYLNFIRTENAPRHVENKISMLRRFVGSERVERLPHGTNNGALWGDGNPPAVGDAAGTEVPGIHNPVERVAGGEGLNRPLLPRRHDNHAVLLARADKHPDRAEPATAPLSEIVAEEDAEGRKGKK